MLPRLRLLFLLLLTLAATLPSAWSQTAGWIWSGGEENPERPLFFRRVFTIESGIRGGQLDLLCKEEATVFLNGKEIGRASGELMSHQIRTGLTGGKNVLAVRVKNAASRAGLIAVLRIEEEYGKSKVIVSDRSWLTSTAEVSGWEKAGFDSKGWTPAAPIEKAAPEAKVFVSESGGAVPASQLKVPEGFKVELLRSAQPGEGSWVAMAVDEKGRLYLSPQGKEKMARVTLDAAGLVERFETINLPVTSSMGMLWAFDSLYVSGVGPDGQAIYRLRDTNGDDQLDLVQLFKKIAGGADEHGPHAIVLGPDNHLYIAHGNSTPILDQVSPVSPYRSWAEDTLLPRVMDPVATFFSNLKTPYGQVWRTDPEGKTWELFAGGFRNQYDIDFNAEGDLFTYDSDMEWDIGLPWYRPTRILHVMSGAEFGFREGNSKWPESYPDSVPAVVNIGLGCPTGVKFGTKSHFPEKYRRAFFAMDWTFGRILAVHMHPKGSSYTAANPLPSPYDLKTSNAGGDVEEFLSGKAMPVSDLEFGRDGAMYFVVGGRGTQSGLYRVSYTGAVEAPRDLSGAPALAERTIRGSLEAFHGKENGIAVETAWPHLHSTDRAIRFSARVAIESQPVAQWRERALSETEPRAALTALLALARCGSTSDQAPLLKALARFPLDSLDEEWFLNKLRVIEVSFARHGLPAEPLVSLAREKLGRQYPSKSFALNRELSELLVLLGDPEVVGKTLALLRSSEVSAEQIWYANVLREARGWTHAQRSEYFSWFHKARDYRGGNSFTKFIERIKELAIAKLSDAERGALGPILENKPTAQPLLPAGPVRDFQKAWSIAELTVDIEKDGKKERNFARGREIYVSLQCAQCHRFGEFGGNVGPDLSAVGNRFNRHDLLESIIDPSKVISEQYASALVTTTAGETLFGPIAEEDATRLVMVSDPVKGTRQTIPKEKIASRQISPVSMMPPGLVNVLTKEEILDLLAYLESGGNPAAPAFQSTPKK